MEALTANLSTLAAAAGAAATGALAHALFHPRSRLFSPVISRAPNTANLLALTFDDGPWEGSTEHILEALHAAGATATFFVIGVHARKSPTLLRQIHHAGHLLANHTFDHHRTGLFRGRAYWLDQLRRTSDTIAEVTGSPPLYLRPPMGFKSPPLVHAARDLNLTLVAWSRRARDGVGTTPDRIRSALGSLSAGDIALLHDGRDPASTRDVHPTRLALPPLLADLQLRGLKSVRLDQLLTPPASG